MTIHYAQTLDGRIATRTGDSQWISGQTSLRLAHQLRAEHDAAMLGIGTVLVDNPRLTARLVPGRSPRRIVVDSTLRIPLEANVLAGASETILATTARASPERIGAVRERGAVVLVTEQTPEGRVDLRDLLAQLTWCSVGSILLEGGGTLMTAALRQRLVDRLVICIAPKMIGAGIEAIGDLGVRKLGEALTFSCSRFYPLGEDMIFDGQIAQ